MSKENNKGNRGSNTDYEKRGYQPGKGGSVTGGHKPEKSESKPVNPPKKNKNRITNMDRCDTKSRDEVVPQSMDGTAHVTGRIYGPE